MEVGRLCVKLAGRDAGRVAVVVDTLDSKFVLIDGNVRRRKCNIMHLEPLDEIIKIKKGASHSEVSSEFKKLKLDTWETKAKKKTEKPISKRKQNKKTIKEVVKETKSETKETKKEIKKEEKKVEKPVKKKEVKK